MMILLACDCPIESTRLRQALEHAGYHCPLGNVIGVEAAGKLHQHPDLLVVVLPAEHDLAHAIVKRVRETLDAPILAVGPREPNLILCALRAGANDFVDQAGDLRTELGAAIGRVTTALAGRSALGRLVTVVAAGGGSGRTLLTTNLAVTLAKAQVRCVLLDFDFGAGDVATVLNLKPRHTSADLCRNVDKLDQKMFEQSLLEHESGVSVLAAPESWEALAHMTGDGLEKIVKYARLLFPAVVVDLESFWLAEFSHLLQQSSEILLMCRLDLTTIRNTRRALEYFNRIHVERDNVKVIAARTGRAKEISVAQAETVLEKPIEFSIPEEPSGANLSINCGVPLVIESPSCALSKAIACLARATIRQHKPVNGEKSHLQTGHGGLPVFEKVRLLLGMNERSISERINVLTGN